MATEVTGCSRHTASPTRRLGHGATRMSPARTVAVPADQATVAGRHAVFEATAVLEVGLVVDAG